jgi:hypothetical protein
MNFMKRCLVVTFLALSGLTASLSAAKDAPAGDPQKKYAEFLSDPKNRDISDPYEALKRFANQHPELRLELYNIKVTDEKRTIQKNGAPQEVTVRCYNIPLGSEVCSSAPDSCKPGERPSCGWIQESCSLASLQSCKEVEP